mmetsp:Transcript_34387/g.65715  ORF Transcript_34387/g.65715 Transcript_34387/m.65715 type:complete len:169 (+) Transcript_34387:148-654(+)
MDGCHRCGRTGHQARDCKQPMMCNKCGMRGHTEKNCGDSDNMKSARDRLREQKRQEICHNCGQRGHMARDCTSRVNCRMCGQDGHFTRECPRNGGSAASLIHSRNHEANMFAQERQRVLLQETAGDKLFFIFLPQNDLATCRCVFCRVIYHASLHPCHEGYILPVCDT